MIIYKLKRLLLSLTICAAVFPPGIPAQSLSSLEKQYDKSVSELETEISKLDSLKSMFEDRAEEIEAEKARSDSDEDKIKYLMANSINLSKQIDRKEDLVDGLKLNVDNIKSKLYRLYSEKLDSLKSIRDSGRDEDEIEDEILAVTSKRLLVYPRVLPLSFNPDKMADIDLSQIKNKNEKSMYQEYIAGAYSEVSELSKRIGKLSDELSHMIRLENKTRKFLEETGFDTPIRTATSGSSNKISETSGFVEGTTDEFEISMQLESYNIILNQLRSYLPAASDNFTGYELIDNTKNLSAEEYLKLLKQIQQSLEDYKLVLQKKYKLPE